MPGSSRVRGSYRHGDEGGEQRAAGSAGVAHELEETRPTTSWVLRANGDGTFAAPLWFAAGAGQVSLLVADLDADGRKDILVGSGFGFGSPGVLFNTSR